MVRPRIDEVSVTGHGVYPNKILGSSGRTGARASVVRAELAPAFLFLHGRVREVLNAAPLAAPGVREIGDYRRLPRYQKPPPPSRRTTRMMMRSVLMSFTPSEVRRPFRLQDWFLFAEVWFFGRHRALRALTGTPRGFATTPFPFSTPVSDSSRLRGVSLTSWRKEASSGEGSSRR
jgi:hypothetical protein